MSTRTAAAAATAKLQQLSAAVDGSDSEVGFDDLESQSALSEEESDFGSGRQTTSKKGEPPKKKAKQLVPRVKQEATPMKRGKKSLSLLPTIPLDVLFEIFSQLTPKDLLNVSRTSKSFRETLLSGGAKTVWKYALQCAGAPECPSDVKEPRWARLLFGTSCESCGAKNVQKVDFFLRRRVCTACKKKNLVVKSKVERTFPGCDDMILNLIPSTNVGGWAHGHSSSSKFFWKSDLEEMIHTVASYKQKKNMGIPGAQNEYATFITQRMGIVQDVHSSEAQFSAWLSDVRTGRHKETQQSMQSRQDAICDKFLDLGYEQADLSVLWSQNAYTQKAALTDSIWKRICPILEPCVKERKDQRIAAALRPTKNSRRDLLDRLYSADYKATISPPLWKYLPGIAEIGEREPFKALLNAELGVTVTIDDFRPFIPKFAEVITEIQDELKNKLVQCLSQSLEPGQTLPSNCLDLATSIFCCKGQACNSTFYVIGTDNILSHNCGHDTYSTIMFYDSYGDRKLEWCRDLVMDAKAVAIAKALIRCAGLDPETALASEMDHKDLRFACVECGNGRPSGIHGLAHAKSRTYVKFVDHNDWRLLSPAEATHLKYNEQQDSKWTLDKWVCSYCPSHLLNGGTNRPSVLQHLKDVHNIMSPTVPVDLFFFEKVVMPFRQPTSLLYTPPTPVVRIDTTKNVICLNCSSGGPSARNRLFCQQGIVSHLKSKHFINSPVQGTHWQRQIPR